MIFSVIKMDGSNNSAGLNSGLHYQALTGSFCVFCFSEHGSPLKECKEGGVLKPTVLHQSQWRSLSAKPQRKSVPRSRPHPLPVQKLFFILPLRLSASTLTWLFIVINSITAIKILWQRFSFHSYWLTMTHPKTKVPKVTARSYHLLETFGDIPTG